MERCRPKDGENGSSLVIPWDATWGRGGCYVPLRIFSPIRGSVCRWRMGMWAKEEYTRVRGRFIGHRVLSEGDRPEGEHWGRNMKFRAIRGEVSSFLSPSVWRQTIERRCSERNRARLRLRYLIICREAFLIPSGNCRGGRREEERGDNKSFAVTREGMILFSFSFLLFQSSDRFNRSILPSPPPGRGWESRL